jgi:hypothetical protein
MYSIGDADVTTLTRDQLYEMVWKEPPRTVAPRLGISDVALAKRCRKLHIPLPWRGYWREKETGHKPRQPKLPPWPKHLGEEPEAITFHAAPPPGKPPAPRPPEPESVQLQRAYETDPDHQIQVPEQLTDQDRLVKRAARLLKRSGDRSLLRPSEWPCLDIQVTKTSLDRALRVFDAILKAVRSRGWSVTTRSEQPLHTQVTVLDEVISIQLLEKVRQVEKPQPVKRDVYLFSYERYEYQPTGMLTVRLTDGDSFAWQSRTWNDGKRQRIESCLHDIMIGFVELAERRKEARREQERRQREWEENERRRLAAAERHEREKDRREELKRQIASWSRAQEVTVYLNALEETASEIVQREPNGRLARWIRWARIYSNRIDPLTDLDSLPLDPEGYGRAPLDLDAYGKGEPGEGIHASSTGPVEP